MTIRKYMPFLRRINSYMRSTGPMKLCGLWSMLYFVISEFVCDSTKLICTNCAPKILEGGLQQNDALSLGGDAVLGLGHIAIFIYLL